MCRVTVEVDQETLRGFDPSLDSTDDIRNWVQQLVNMRIQQMAARREEYLYLQPTDLRHIEMVGEEAETIDLETARAMLHQTIHEEYAKV